MSNTETVNDDPETEIVSRRRRRAPWSVLPVALVMIALVWVLVAASSGDAPDDGYTPLMGKPAPAVRTTTLDGEPFDLQRRKGSWIVLNFFDPTCVPCVREHPQLVEFSERQQLAGTSGAELYTVIFGDRENSVADFFAANGGTWPVLTDPVAAIQTSFGVTKVPETWIIDPEGRVVYRAISQVTADQLTLELSTLRLRRANPPATSDTNP